jgi:hypothetical protein
MKILESAAKLVFILMAITSCVALFLNKLNAEQFMVLTSGAFAFFFAFKGDPNLPYVGK